VIYQHPRGPPFKASLKWLAQKWLKKEIQTNVGASAVVEGNGVVEGENGKVVGGHDSEEDARTCVELLNLKMQKGQFWSSPSIPLCDLTELMKCGVRCDRPWIW